jgi:hypothetical protein
MDIPVLNLFEINYEIADKTKEDSLIKTDQAELFTGILDLEEQLNGRRYAPVVNGRIVTKEVLIEHLNLSDEDLFKYRLEGLL